MGYIQQANDIVSNSSQLLDDILSSKFNQFLSGQGQPVLVTYWNINDTVSTVNNGTETIDQLLGSESPFRYNKIENMPMYGPIKDILPEIVQEDGPLDIELNVEGYLLPDTVKPSEFDFFEYRFGKNLSRSIIFMVNNFTLSTIKSNGYYKLEAHLIDIDDCNGYRDKLDKQVTKNFETNLETLGTNDKCIIESKHFKFIKDIRAVIDDLRGQYLNMFYSGQYNAIVYDKLFHNEYLGWDPWVTEFIIRNGIFSSSSKTPIALVNFDPVQGFQQKYNMTFFHAVEIRNMKYLKNLRYTPESFSRLNTNPFAYYGEEIAFKVDIYEDEPAKYSGNTYMNLLFKNNIEQNKKTNVLTEFECILVDYFNQENLSNIISEDIVSSLKNFVFEYNEYWFRFGPILMYVLDAICQDINNSYS